MPIRTEIQQRKIEANVTNISKYKDKHNITEETNANVRNNIRNMRLVTKLILMLIVGKIVGKIFHTRSSLKVKHLKEMSVTSETGFQQLWVQIQLEKLRSIVLCVAYQPEYCPVSGQYWLKNDNKLHGV